jgi:ribonuclease-3
LNTGEPINLLLRELGYSFTDDALLERALTHVSTDRHKSGNHNEVLEFLGDAVLDLAVSDLLIQHNPDKTEGDLSRMRAALVNSTVLAEKAGALNLGALLRVGKGEERSEGRSKPSILAGAFEAILGAVYRDGGYEAARSVVERFFLPEITGKQLGQQDFIEKLEVLQ